MQRSAPACPSLELDVSRSSSVLCSSGFQCCTQIRSAVCGKQAAQHRASWSQKARGIQDAAEEGFGDPSSDSPPSVAKQGVFTLPCQVQYFSSTKKRPPDQENSSRRCRRCSVREIMLDIAWLWYFLEKYVLRQRQSLTFRNKPRK